MKAKTVFIAAAALLAAACSPKPVSPVEEALKAKIAENAGTTPENVQIYSIEQIDSVKLGEEIGRRRETISLRRRVNNDKFVEYSSRGLQQNAELRLKEIRADDARLAALDGIELAHKSQMDSVIARDYRFSGRLRAEGGSWTETGEMFTSITPSLRVLAVTTSQRDLHKSTGHAIPGYDALFE